VQTLEKRFTFSAVFLFNDGTSGHHYIVAVLIQLDDFELKALTFQVCRIAHRPDVDKRTRQKRSHAFYLNGESAFDAAIDNALHDFTILEGFFKIDPGACADRFFT
jgi:hypothetical protein